MQELSNDHEAILGALSARGVATSQDLQASLGKSQATVSRLLADLSSRVLALGRARSTRYGLPKSIHGQAAQQDIWWIDETGDRRRIGQLTLLAGDVLHVGMPFLDVVSRDGLPWFLSPLKAQGFLGRVLAHRLQGEGLNGDPDAWSLEATLYAALQLHDAPGAIVLGALPQAESSSGLLPEDPGLLADALDALALDVARTLPAGSSAGGEQPKFLARSAEGLHQLVKFTPPRGTPFGERWHDLLHAEALASEVLRDHGVAVAACRIVQSAQRSYLVSDRFDRVGPSGRCHVVSIGAVHRAFAHGSYQNWAASCEALARQKRLAPLAAEQAAALLMFGRLIGNTDMHSGNLGLTVPPDGLAKGRGFGLAPVYDMLPMRWRPDATLGGAPDYTPLEPDAEALASAARQPALVFWQRLAVHPELSKALRQLAKQMSERLS